MKEVKLLMDEKRNLFIKDKDGVIYNFWALGWGVPVSLIVETDKEAEEKRQREKEAQIKELEEYEQRQSAKKKKRWFN